MPREVDNIEIQGPPIDEIQKRSSCLRQGCVSFLVTLFFSLVFLLLFIHVVVKPRAKTLDELPKSFPDSIPLYDVENLDTITYTSGKERGQAVELLAFVPKAILSPLILALEHSDATETTDEPLWESFLRILGSPVTDHRNVISMEWSHLQASPTFIYSYYVKTLSDAGFHKTSDGMQFPVRFSDDEYHTTISLDIRDDDNEKNGTGYAILRVYYQ